MSNNEFDSQHKCAYIRVHAHCYDLFFYGFNNRELGPNNRYDFKTALPYKPYVRFAVSSLCLLIPHPTTDHHFNSKLQI